MRVFLSWSGDLSHGVAQLLHDWLPSVIQTIDPFISSDSIEKGSRWGAQLTEGLSTSGFGLICLTSDNLASPWMIFEAGALSEGLSADRVCPVLVDIQPQDLKGPLAEFQGTALTKEDIFKLIASINRAAEEQAVDPSRLGRSFEALWPEFESSLNALFLSHANRPEESAKETVSSRTFKLLTSHGTLINPSDDSRNIAFKVETVNLLLNSLAAEMERCSDTEATRASFEEAGYQAARVFGERIHERWGLEFPDDTLMDRIDRWCLFDSDVGWGRLVNELNHHEDDDSVTGGIRLMDNFQTYKRPEGSYPDCYLMHGYVRGVLEALTDGMNLTVRCDPEQCPLGHRRKKDCFFVVETGKTE